MKQAGRDAPAAALRQELLELLLDARHELVAALAEPAPAGDDPVRALFRAPGRGSRRSSAQVDGELPAEGALRYLAFVAAGDALAALDAAAPAFGLELSSDGLRRLARTLAPSAPGDPLARSDAVDPELREIFGFGPPLPLPAPREPTPEAVTRRARPSRRRTRGGAELGAAAAASAARSPGCSSPPRTRRRIPGRGSRRSRRRLNRWAPSRDDFRDYLPLAGRLLRGVAGDVQHEGALAAPYRDLYSPLLLAAGWQESCWRQYVRRAGRLVPLRSSTGDVGLMQVNERVWRGFYSVQALRSDVAYNARAGGEILLHYLRDFALARGEAKNGGLEALARATYAMYNGGPSALRRWRDPGAPAALRAVDAAFLRKYRAIRAGDEEALEDCYTG